MKNINVKKNRQLNLNKETLRALSKVGLDGIRGGAGGRICTDGSGCEKSTTCNR